jgi:hypothetical protein
VTIYESLVAKGPAWLAGVLGPCCNCCVHRGNGLGCHQPLGSCVAGMTDWLNQEMDPIKLDCPEPDHEE